MKEINYFKVRIDVQFLRMFELGHPMTNVWPCAVSVGTVDHFLNDSCHCKRRKTNVGPSSVGIVRMTKI